MDIIQTVMVKELTELATPRQVAEYLGLKNPETVRVWVRQGRLRAIRPGGRSIRIERRMLERFLAASMDAPPSYRVRQRAPKVVRRVSTSTAIKAASFEAEKVSD